MKKYLLLILAIMCLNPGISHLFGSEYFISPSGNDENSGTLDKPFKTIQKAADIMVAGDTCTVLEGTYREWVKPRRGGESEDLRILYRAAPGQAVFIKGSEQINTWEEQDGGIWKANLEDSFFGDYNPFTENLKGEFIVYGQEYHMGDIYLNGSSFREMMAIDEVQTQPHTFFAFYENGTTTVFANFADANPNQELTEINVRECVIFPEIKGLRYISIEGFHLQHAAANWVAFRAFQHALIGTYYGKHWTIQNNTITDARCVAVVCGNDPSHQDEGFDIQATGHHLVRNNLISRCGEAGIHGFKGWVGSIIENNLIEDINTKDEFGGWETAGIKIHDGVDITIRNNVFRRVHGSKKRGEFAAVWIDWGGQGVRVSGNIIYDCTSWGLYLQNNHGPILVDNNIIAGPMVQASDNCIFVHNLFADSHLRYDVTNSQFDVVYYEPHSATPVGIEPKSYINDIYFSNIFYMRGSNQIPQHLNYKCDYNLLYAGAEKSSWGDQNSQSNPLLKEEVRFTTLENGVKISWSSDELKNTIPNPPFHSDLAGKMGLPGQRVENPDGTSITIDYDIIGNPRNASHPIVGPLEYLKDENLVVRTVPGAGNSVN